MDQATDPVEARSGGMDPRSPEDSHTNGTAVNSRGAFPSKVGLDVCLVQQERRDLTPSPINFCDEFGWGPAAEFSRALRETSVGSETSIRTADGMLDDDSKTSGRGSLSPIPSTSSPAVNGTPPAISPDSVTSPVTPPANSVTPPIISPTNSVTSPVVDPVDSVTSPDMSLDDIEVEVVEIKDVPTEQSMSPSLDENTLGKTADQHSSTTNSSLHTANVPDSSSSPITEGAAAKHEVVEDVSTVSAVTASMAALAVKEIAVSSSQPKDVTVVVGATKSGSEGGLLLPSKETAKEKGTNVPVIADENEMEEQWELMRNHLRHSRRRYSGRYKKRRPQELEPGNTGSLDRRFEGSGNHGSSPSLQRSATISGARKAYLKGLYGKTEGEGSNVDPSRKTATLGRFKDIACRGHQ